MSVIYNQTIINARLNGVVTELGALANLVLKAGGTTISTIQLASPVGTVSGGVGGTGMYGGGAAAAFINNTNAGSNGNAAGSYGSGGGGARPHGAGGLSVVLMASVLALD